MTADTKRTGKRDKGAGGVIELDNGRFQAWAELSPDPADGSRKRRSLTPIFGRTTYNKFGIHHRHHVNGLAFDDGDQQ